MPAGCSRVSRVMSRQACVGSHVTAKNNVAQKHPWCQPHTATTVHNPSYHIRALPHHLTTVHTATHTLCQSLYGWTDAVCHLCPHRVKWGQVTDKLLPWWRACTTAAHCAIQLDLCRQIETWGMQRFVQAQNTTRQSR
jgi:hypothetical protein